MSQTLQGEQDLRFKKLDDVKLGDNVTYRRDVTYRNNVTYHHDATSMQPVEPTKKRLQSDDCLLLKILFSLHVPTAQ